MCVCVIVCDSIAKSKDAGGGGALATCSRMPIFSPYHYAELWIRPLRYSNMVLTLCLPPTDGLANAEFRVRLHGIDYF